MSDYILTDLVRELARPFPSKYVKEVQGNAYVPHHIVTQRLIHIFKQPPTTEIVREIYDDIQTPSGGSRTLSGVVMRMTIGGVVVEECGEADNPQAKTNGAKAKSAASDAYKRCAMRLGLGLHLWAQGDYFLFDKLNEDDQPTEIEVPKEVPGAATE